MVYLGNFLYVNIYMGHYMIMLQDWSLSGSGCIDFTLTIDMYKEDYKK